MSAQKKQFPSHNDRLVSLKKIEGQIRGIQRMVQTGHYCVDIINQISAATHALHRVSEQILARHMENCVANAMHGNSASEKQKKVEEVLNIIHRMRK